LIEEKRELEDNNAKLTAQNYQLRQRTGQTNSSTIESCQQQERDSIALLEKFLAEKDSYICKLEKEISDMRKDMCETNRS